MKAIILAGGEGTRLQPISLGKAKTMTPLFDRPVLEHLIELLNRNGIWEICVTLGRYHQEVMDYFENGERFGVHLTYRVEEVPLGTAGSVKSCADFIGGEDVLVVGGDSVCDLDLTAAVEFHREKNAGATVVICSHPRPLEYGMVLVDDEGRVEQFVEKPSWRQVVTNMVNTGIYILSPNVLDHIPAGEEWDFGEDVFPAMLERGEALYACAAQGYWRDMGDCESYLECICDALNGKVKLNLGGEPKQTGVWSAEPLPEGVTIVPPCWIGVGVSVGAGSLIGPHVMLGQGSRVGRRGLVQRSVLLGAQVGERATVYGAVLCQKARLGDETVLNEGVVLGEQVLVNDRAVLMERVRLWPGRMVRHGARITRSVAGSETAGPVRFGDGGVIRGVLGEDLNAEALLMLGRALGGEGKVAIGSFGGAGAQMLLRSVAGGITEVGGTALYHDMECAAQAAWLAECYQMPISLFIEQDGEKVYLHLFDSMGLPLGRGRERKLEQAMLRGEFSRVDAESIGRCEKLPTRIRDYAKDAVRRCRLHRIGLCAVRVAVTGRSPADRGMRLILEELGCQVTDQWQRGIPEFCAGYSGLSLSARDESGTLLSPQQLLAMVALVEMENGGGRLAVPDEASAAVDLVAAGFNGTVLRLGTDGETARQLYHTLPWLRDAAFAAARLCARMAASGERLEQISWKTPRFSSWKREVALMRDRGEIMRELAAQAGKETRVGEGIRLRSRGGWVYLVPLARRSAVRIIAEGSDLEVAAELCDFYADQVMKLDRTPKRQTK